MVMRGGVVMRTPSRAVCDSTRGTARTRTRTRRGRMRMGTVVRGNGGARDAESMLVEGRAMYERGERMNGFKTFERALKKQKFKFQMEKKVVGAVKTATGVKLTVEPSAGVSFF